MLPSVLSYYNREIEDMLLSFIFASILTVIISQEHPNAISGGSWELVVPESDGGAVGKSLEMQTVHGVLLPSGEILVASGSNWRNRGPIQTHPQSSDPEGAEGVFQMKNDPLNMTNREDYFQQVNTAGVYNPTRNTFYRIPHPVPVPDPKWPNHFVPSDLFCTGHLHIPDGNVLFVGGTQYYHPFRTGHRATYVYDWRKHVNITWNQVDWRRMPIINDTSSDPNYPWIFSGMS